MSLEKFDESDHLKKIIADGEVQRAELALQAAVAKRDLFYTQLAAKYGMGEGDTYDPQTLAIKRAAKPEPAAKKKLAAVPGEPASKSV